MQDWNADLYLKFSNERTQPALDLVNRIQNEFPARVLDVGCGPGNSTAVLAARFPGASVLGIDSSPAMLESARKSYPQLQWELCDAEHDLHKLESDFDLVFSNACLQWISNHPALLPSLFGLLKAGGTLAVQLPNNEREPIHLLLKELAQSEKWGGYFPDLRSHHTLPPGEYCEILSALTNQFAVWEVVYYHVMDSHESILNWYRSTGMRPYLNQLPADKVPEYEADVLREIERRYPPLGNGMILFRFPRLFFTAVK